MVGRNAFPEVRFASSDDARLATLAPVEWREKAAAQHFARDARLELVVGGLLAEMLAAYGVVSPRFVTGEFGKPELANAEGLHFSLSHTEGVVMVVLADRPVGCDIERVQPESGRDRAFYEVWTRREAGLKMRGCGFADGATPDDPPNPSARNIPAPDGCVAAICL